MRASVVSVASLLFSTVGFTGQGTIIISNFIPNSKLDKIVVDEVATVINRPECIEFRDYPYPNTYLRKFVSTYDLTSFNGRFPIILDPSNEPLRALCRAAVQRVSIEVWLNRMEGRKAHLVVFLSEEEKRNCSNTYTGITPSPSTSYSTITTCGLIKSQDHEYKDLEITLHPSYDAPSTEPLPGYPADPYDPYGTYTYPGYGCDTYKGYDPYCNTYNPY